MTFAMDGCILGYYLKMLVHCAYKSIAINFSSIVAIYHTNESIRLTQTKHLLELDFFMKR